MGHAYSPLGEPRSRSGRHRPRVIRAHRAAEALLIVLACLMLAACGGATASPEVTPTGKISPVATDERTTALPSPTRSATATLLPTASATRRPPPSASPRPSATPTVTASATRTATSLPTATATATASPVPTAERVEAQVLEVIDGDTVTVSINGQSFRVRYIGIDTPEIVHPGLPVEPLGPEAAEANRQLVLGRQVWLERDVTDADDYGRLLRYVWVGDVMVNAELVRLGLAKANSYPPDTRYQAYLESLEQEAVAARRGIWGLSPTAPPEPGTSRGHALGVYIASVDKRGKPESVTLTNDGPAPVDISGWTLVSVRGNQRYLIPGGTVLPPGGSVTVYSGPGADSAGGLCWTTDHVWNNSELDPAELYDGAGTLVDRWEG